MSALGHEDIRRLDVAMNDAFRVRRIERIRDLNGQRQSHIGFHRTPRDPVLQRHPVQKLHGDESLPMLIVNLVDRADIGMVQRGSGLSFPLEAGQGLRIFGNLVRQEF
jgi:hypothetical protein